MLNIPPIESGGPLMPEQKAKWAERNAADKDFDAFVRRATDRERREVTQRDRRKNEEIIADAVEDMLKEQIAASRAKIRPNPIAAELYRGDIARVMNWCDDFNVGYPMTGHTIAGLLFEEADGGRETIEPERLDRLRRLWRALLWSHDSNGDYLDHAPVEAMLSFLESKVKKSDGTKDVKDARPS